MLLVSLRPGLERGHPAAVQAAFGQVGGALTTKLLLRLYSYAVIVIFVPIAVSQTAERAKKPEEEQNKGLIDLSRSEN
jgi:hypothetical protein